MLFKGAIRFPCVPETLLFGKFSSSLQPFALFTVKKQKKRLQKFYKLTKIDRLFPFDSECQAEGKYESYWNVKGGNR